MGSQDLLRDSHRRDMDDRILLTTHQEETNGQSDLGMGFKRKTEAHQKIVKPEAPEDPERSLLGDRQDMNDRILLTTQQEDTNGQSDLGMGFKRKTVETHQKIVKPEAPEDPERSTPYSTLGHDFGRIRAGLKAYKDKIDPTIEGNQDTQSGEILKYISKLELTFQDEIEEEGDAYMTRQGFANFVVSKNPTGKPKRPSRDYEAFNPISGEHLREEVPLAVLKALEVKGEDLETAMDRIRWVWLRKLNELLHEVITVEDAVKTIKKEEGDFKALFFQQFVLRTIDVLYKYKLIDPEHLDSFLAIRDTLEYASLMQTKAEVFVSALYFSGFNKPGCLGIPTYSKHFIKSVSEGIRIRYPKDPENWMNDERYSLKSPHEEPATLARGA
ncbi:hypothetical protein MJO28_010583 [Puccinia striiformis f. sp. tritici]|uniref:Uncharacterized protein n=1 Tax=Puccinia striiformis f. sp. tritici TaxID=168172 RepID=A0ACC0E818_9BASI|nr:hypothetical protein MJO28_017391 [Puccinia striiformis f. sp. tritici]KAI7944888.1 hypothetical protein MJO28_010583 [Puccinia striiformis f. sp. tritici]